MKRPLSISIIGGFFIGMGTFVILANLFWMVHGQGLVHGQAADGGGHGDEVWVFATELLAIVAGVYLLRGRNWARWLLVAWLVFHVGLSAVHPGHDLIVHGAISVVIIYFLFRAPANEFFRGGTAGRTPGGTGG